MSDYFSEFGTAGKLLDLFKEFQKGKYRITKTLKPENVEKRMDVLRGMEAEMPEKELPANVLIPFEIQHFGTPFHIFPEAKDCFAVVDVDTKYSPKFLLYNLATGSTGMMKILKATYKKQPLQVGDVFRLETWQKKPAYQYVDGKPKPKPGVYDLWLNAYTKL